MTKNLLPTTEQTGGETREKAVRAVFDLMRRGEEELNIRCT